MADEEQKYKISFDTNAKDAAKDTNALGASIERTTDATAEASKATKDLSSATDKSTKANKEQKASFEDLGGGVGDAIGQVKQLGKQFLALLANPVVLFLTAIVGALALLYKAFTSTDAGAEKMEQAMAGISATIDVLRDRVLKVGGAIAKFFSGDFKGALADARTAVSGIGDEIAREFAKASEATRILQELEDTMRDLSVGRARLNRDLVQSRELLQDENASYAQKKKALKEVGQAEQEQTALELKANKEKLAALKSRNELSDISDEKKNEQAELERTIFGLQEESARNQIKLNKQSAQLDREEIARKKALAEERKRLSEEERKRLETLSLEQQEEQKRASELIDTSYDDAEQKKQDHENAMNDIAAKARQTDYDDQKRVDSAMLEQKKHLQDTQLTLAEKAVGFLYAIAGKNKTLQKAAIIAESALGIGRSVIATNASNVAAVAEGAALAIPSGGASVAAASALVTANYVALGLGTAANIAATAKALSALGGGSAPSASGGGARSASPSVSFNNTAENQIGQSVAKTQGEQAPIKVVVSESDITDAQVNVRALVLKNTI